MNRIRLAIAIGYPESDHIRNKVRKGIYEIMTFVE